MRKPTVCICENKGADQLRGNREADQRLCFRYTDSTFPPLLIPKFSRFWVTGWFVLDLIGKPKLLVLSCTGSNGLFCSTRVLFSQVVSYII